MARKTADAAIGATKAALIEMGRKHGRDIRLVNPAHTTMDCAHCDARAKHRLPLMAEDLLERCSRRRPEPGIPFPSGRGGFNNWVLRTT
ncbi:hypothetical protein QF037_009462 [Streptomyces canus]|nr:hypothetical protein [Streptomyces canus]